MTTKNDEHENGRENLKLIKNKNFKKTSTKPLGWRKAAEVINKSDSERTAEQITNDLYKMREDNKFNN